MRTAQNHPSVVAYSMSHNAAGHDEDMNPDFIDGVQDPRGEYSQRVANLALRAEAIVKQFVAPRLASAVILLQKLPGRRLFQYGSEAGELRAVTAREVNSFLRDIADEKISLKDFRTLLASAHVLKALAGAAPAGSARHRRKQVKEAVQTAADELANTPTICRRSYVHDTVVEAFEEGALEPISEKIKSKSLVRSAQAVAEIVGRADLTGT